MSDLLTNIHSAGKQKVFRKVGRIYSIFSIGRLYGYNLLKKRTEPRFRIHCHFYANCTCYNTKENLHNLCRLRDWSPEMLVIE